MQSHLSSVPLLTSRYFCLSGTVTVLTCSWVVADSWVFSIFRSEMCRWGQWSRCHSSRRVSCRRSRQTAPRWLLSSLCCAKIVGGGMVLKNQLQLCQVCRGGGQQRQKAYGSCATKWRAWTLENTTKILLSAAKWHVWIVGLRAELSQIQTTIGTNRESCCCVVWSSAWPSLQREAYAIDCTILFLFPFVCFFCSLYDISFWNEIENW